MSDEGYSKRHIILFLVASFISLAAEPALALIQTDMIYIMDDTYVNNSAADTNFDNLALMIGNPGGINLESWYRFNLSDPSGYYVVGAVLQTYVESVSLNKNYDLYNSSGTSWTESDLTWNTKPAYGTSVHQNQIATTGWWSWTITDSYSRPFSTGASFVSYMLGVGGAGSSTMVIEDKENTRATGNVPYLNLTMMIPETYSVSPSDLYSTYDTTITFQYNTTDAGNIVNCSIILDGSINKTNSSVTENTTASFTVQNIFPGDHTWAIQCYDSNRYTYEMTSATRDLTVLASVEWYNPSSATPLDIGSVLLGGAEPSGTREVYANNTNENVEVSCMSGDCGTISTNWTAADMAGGSTLAASFNCSSAAAGSYAADFEVVSDQDTSADTLTVNCSILAPDLRINSTNITFSDSTPSEGQTVTITAGVYNIGTYEATDAVVRFYEGNYALGNQIGSDHSVTLAPGASTTVQEDWTSKIGDYDIYVVLDPPVDTNGSIAEADESNNFAYAYIGIPMWTVFVGNVTGSLALQTEDNSTLLKWTVADTTDSLLYVSDSDSSPDFASLVALGRNTSGAYMPDDFAELDSIINTTQYPDSINLTFTSGGSPLHEQTFVVFGNSIDYVPVVYTTNTSSFVTGILWDSADDTNNNNQFDDTSQEDVVLVTRVNKSQAGMYGVYDYEIRVPAKLKDFDSADSLTVAFYTEIK